ncbi:hypothetical protein [Staphylococcus phage S6]|nr:hypothetical protein [Staphylococcus phage S6]
MKYYILTQQGIAEVLGIDSESVYCYRNLFRDDELYLKEDEEIKFSEIITNQTPDIEYKVVGTNKDTVTVIAYMEIDLGEGDYHQIGSCRMKLDKDRTLEEVYNIVYEKMSNRTFSFNKAKEMGISLYEESDYEEVSKKEYKKYKVENNFK